MMTDEQKAEFKRKMAEAKAKKKSGGAEAKPAEKVTTVRKAKPAKARPKTEKQSPGNDHQFEGIGDDDSDWLL